MYEATSKNQINMHLYSYFADESNQGLFLIHVALAPIQMSPTYF